MTLLASTCVMLTIALAVVSWFAIELYWRLRTMRLAHEVDQLELSQMRTAIEVATAERDNALERLEKGMPPPRVVTDFQFETAYIDEFGNVVFKPDGDKQDGDQ